ncbi:MAG: Cold shock-like protein CspA [Alphaproteobacteria bacterium MarineAlpha3_Bin7]|mgnify:FL=1|nr:cold-shock protein [Rhodospirillaceae bacterium]PPR63795.1 MAG: Cold shock-like protein CspA [Alphaproteobacteria bacterium MarineAlpha3_Bin7]
MATGTVKWFNKTKGFGFIIPDNGDKDVFVHITAVVESGLNELVEGQKVSFESIEEPKGLKATNISELPDDEDN